MKTFREEFLTQHMSKQDIAQYAEVSVTTISTWFTTYHDRIKADFIVGKNKKMYKKDDVTDFLKWLFQKKVSK